MSGGQKLSFSFSKTIKKNTPKSSKPVDLIKCIEDKVILTENQTPVTSAPLVIEVKASRNISDRIKEAQEKRKLAFEEKPDSELTLDELAAKELLKESQNGNKKTKTSLEISQVSETDGLEGSKESTLEDYESVPITEFGLAMLRGMGWKEGVVIGKNQNKSTKLPSEPVLRPKGMGLGANKVTKTQDNSNDDQLIKRGTLVKITAGKYEGNVGKVQSFDDEAGRIIVETSCGLVLALNEFLIETISASDYEKLSRTVNKK